jgi:hypothetical protein
MLVTKVLGYLLTWKGLIMSGYLLGFTVLILPIQRIMNNDILLIWIPLVLMVFAPGFQVYLSSLRLKNKITMPLLAIFLMSFLLGLILSVFAMFISMMGLSPQIKCATGCTAFLGLGILITIITTPIIGLVSFIKYRDRQKKLVI